MRQLMVWMAAIPERADLEKLVARERDIGGRVWVIVREREHPDMPPWVLELADRVTLLHEGGASVELKEDSHYSAARTEALAILKMACDGMEEEFHTVKRSVVHAFAVAFADKAAEADRLRVALGDAIEWHEKEHANEPEGSPRVDGWRQALKGLAGPAVQATQAKPR